MLLRLEESNSQKEAQSKQLQELFRGMQMYEERLGLFFDQNGGNSLTVRFTQLDPNDPNRVFYFTIRIHEHSEAFAGTFLVAFLVLLDNISDISFVCVCVCSSGRMSAATCGFGATCDPIEPNE